MKSNVSHLGKSKLDSSTVLEMSKSHDYDTVIVIGLTNNREPMLAVGGLEADYADMQWLAQFAVNTIHELACE